MPEENESCLIEDSIIEDAIKTIQENHRKIIDDWCKAYLAKEYELGNDIHPGCFTLIEQPLDDPTKVGFKYTLEANPKF